LVWLAVFSFSDNNLHLVFCDVGQGDSILIKKGSNQILIDGGPDEKVLECLSRHLPFWDRTIEMVVLTHPQADHLTGLVSVMERYNINHFVINNIVNDTQLFWQFRDDLIKKKAEIDNPKAGERIKIGQLQLLILWPKEELGTPLVWQKASQETLRSGEAKTILTAATYSGDLNETSVVVKLSFGDFDALFTGDMGFDIENNINPGLIEVLKVAHHGSKYSTSTQFLKKIRPQLAVISVGKNRFGHPSPVIIKRLQSFGARVLRTDQNGQIEVVSNGKTW
jgi:competence protein ComEC